MTVVAKWRAKTAKSRTQPIFLRECGKFATVLTSERPAKTARADLLPVDV
jgi:hypothetical protein